MSNKVLLTRSHRHALDRAEDCGYWRPLPLTRSDVEGVTALTCIGDGETSIKAIIQIHRFQEWNASDGVPRLLPLVGGYLEFPQPIPLGDEERMVDWLPNHPDEVQILSFKILRTVKRLSDIRSIPGACTERPIDLAPLIITDAWKAPGRLY